MAAISSPTYIHTGYVTFDLGMVASHILRLPRKQVQLQVLGAGKFLGQPFSNGYSLISSVE